MGDRKVYIPDPTWPNHTHMAKVSGLNYALYDYYNPATKGVAFDRVIDTIK